MRQQQLILRTIAEQNLDPKVPYVAGKNGALVPKRQDSVENKSEGLVEENNVSPAPLMGAMGTISEEDSKEQPVVEAVDDKPKKKFPPPKKKKPTDE
jgi:hypothetical protein